MELQIDHGKVPFLQDYLRNHSRLDVLMLQSLNVQARALPQLDGYYYPPDGHRRWQSYGSNICQHSADIVPVTHQLDPEAADALPVKSCYL